MSLANTFKQDINSRGWGAWWCINNTLAYHLGWRFKTPDPVGKLVVAYRWSAVYNTEP